MRYLYIEDTRSYIILQNYTELFSIVLTYWLLPSMLDLGQHNHFKSIDGLIEENKILFAL